MSVKLSGPMIAPADGVVRQAVVLLHGYGSDGNDLIGLVPYFRDVMPDALFVAPNAPNHCAINPAGYEWFPIDHTREIPDFSGIEAARPVIGDFLSDLWAQTGLGAARTVLAGFSQGAMIALDTGLHLDRPPAGILAFSGGIPPGKSPSLKAIPEISVGLVHGDADPVVPLSMSEHAKSVLEAAGIPVRLHVSAGIGHGIGPDGIDFARAFLAELARRDRD